MTRYEIAAMVLDIEGFGYLLDLPEVGSVWLGEHEEVQRPRRPLTPAEAMAWMRAMNQAYADVPIWKQHPGPGDYQPGPDGSWRPDTENDEEIIAWKLGTLTKESTLTFEVAQ